MVVSYDVNTNILNSMFEGRKTEINYGYGKELRIFYEKDEYISICLNDCNDKKDIIKKAERHADFVLAVIRLLDWISSNKDVSDKITELLEGFYSFDVRFSISKHGDFIFMSCMDREYDIPLKPINMDIKKNPVFNIFYEAMVYNRKRNKYICSNIPYAFMKLCKEEIFSQYKETIMKSKEWSLFERNVKEIYPLYEEFKENMAHYGFRYVNTCTELEITEDITHALNLDSYSFDFNEKDHSAVISFKETKVFIVKKNRVKVELYDDIYMQLKETFRLMWKVQYDLLLLMDSCKKENFCFRITEGGCLCIHTYSSGFISNISSEIYKFVKSYIDKIHNMEKLDEQKKEMLDYISANNVGCLKQCMYIYGIIDFHYFYFMYKMRNIDYSQAIADYQNLPNVLDALYRYGLIREWYIEKDYYVAEFSDNDVFAYESIESNENLRESSRYSLKELFDRFPTKYIKDILINKEYVYKNTKDILAMMDKDIFCREFAKELILSIGFMDKRYMPVLKIKLMKQNAKTIFGEELFKKITDEIQLALDNG